MSIEQRLSVLKQLKQIATTVGLVGKIDDHADHFGMGFDLPEGRRQAVYVRPTGETNGGKTIVTFYSPCLVVKEGMFQGLSKRAAIDLLTRNQTIAFARYGIWNRSGERMIVASVDNLLETLDPEEFEASALCVALAADGYEREHGQDEF